MLTNRGIQLFVVYSVFFALATVTVALRFYVRAVLIRNLGLDDWLAFGAWLLFVAFSALISVAVYHGFNQHISPQSALIVLKFVFASGPLYLVSGMVIKLSIAVMLLRIAAVQRLFRRGIYVITTVYEICCLYILFALILQCLPPAFYWTQFDGDTKGYCVSDRFRVTSVYVFSGVTCLTDWTLAILPWFIVRQMQSANLRTRIMIAIVLGLGSVASVATVARMVYSYRVFHSSDFTSDSTNFLIWTYVELGLSITASSAATLKPLIVKLLPKSSTEGDMIPTPVLTPSRKKNQSSHQKCQTNTTELSLDFSYFEGSSLDKQETKDETN